MGMWMGTKMRSGVTEGSVQLGRNTYVVVLNLKSRDSHTRGVLGAHQLNDSSPLVPSPMVTLTASRASSAFQYLPLSLSFLSLASFPVQALLHLLQQNPSSNLLLRPATLAIMSFLQMNPHSPPHPNQIQAVSHHLLCLLDTSTLSPRSNIIN